MKAATTQFKQSAADTLSDARIQDSLRGLYSGFSKAREKAGEATPGWEEMRTRAQAVKTHTIANLDYYLEQVEARVTESGGNVFFARDGEAASRYILDLVEREGVRRVIKGKSMLSEEMDLNSQLAAAGVEATETDLGEYLIQLAGDTPYHIIAPAIHMSKEQAAELLRRDAGAGDMGGDITELTAEARRQLRGKFIEADMGITGANFVAADTGTLVLVTNEGNGRMCTSMPRIHVAIMGMEKVVPSLEDMGMFLRLLIRSATGQRLSTYVTTVNGPRGPEDEDGPEQFHLVIVDNGRSRILADPHMREALNCIRCGACLNACPVYRKVGGHAYGWVYSGPIGAILTPMMTDLPGSRDLPHASSLCGACREACPVRIDIPRMLLHLRRELAEGHEDPRNKKTSRAEAALVKAWRLSVSNVGTLAAANLIGRVMQWPLPLLGKLRLLPPPLSGWARHRELPRMVSPFRARWKRIRRD